MKLKKYIKLTALLGVVTIAMFSSGCGSSSRDQAKTLNEIGGMSETVNVTVTYGFWGKKAVFEFKGVGSEVQQ